MDIFFPHASSFTVISDSHHNTAMLEEIIPIAARTDGIFMLGDNISDAEYISKRLFMPVYSVVGNCDIGQRGAQELFGQVGSKDGPVVLACHGHKYNVKYDNSKLYYRASERGAAYAFYGHTHLQLMEEYNGITMINPGALRGGEYAVAHIDGSRLDIELHRI